MSSDRKETNCGSLSPWAAGKDRPSSPTCRRATLHGNASPAAWSHFYETTASMGSTSTGNTLLLAAKRETRIGLLTETTSRICYGLYEVRSMQPEERTVATTCLRSPWVHPRMIS